MPNGDLGDEILLACHLIERFELKISSQKLLNKLR